MQINKRLRPLRCPAHGICLHLHSTRILSDLSRKQKIKVGEWLVETIGRNFAFSESGKTRREREERKNTETNFDQDLQRVPRHASRGRCTANVRSPCASSCTWFWGLGLICYSRGSSFEWVSCSWLIQPNSLRTVSSYPIASSQTRWH